MPRFRNLRTGAVVNVEAMPTWDEWEPLEGPTLPVKAVTIDPAEVPEPVTASLTRPHNGASRKAWAAYAESVGVTPGTLTRDELIAAVDEI